MNTASRSSHRRAPRVSYLDTIKVTIKPSKSKSHLKIQTTRSNPIIDDWRTYLSQERVKTIVSLKERCSDVEGVRQAASWLVSNSKVGGKATMLHRRAVVP